MSRGTVRLGVGARLLYDGEAVEVVEFAATGAGDEVVLKDGRGQLIRVAVKELLFSDRAAVVPEEPCVSSKDLDDLASVVLSRLGRAEQERAVDLAGHVRETRFGEAQDWVNDLRDRIEAGDGDPCLSDAFADLTALVARSLLRAEPGDFLACGPQIEQARQRHGNSALYAPVDAAVIAGSFTRAVEIVRDPLAAASFTAIRTLVEREVAVMPRSPVEQIRRSITRLASTSLEQQFWRAVDPYLATGPRLRYRTCTSRPRTPVLGDRTVVARAHSLPQLLWLDWALLLFPRKPASPAVTTTICDAPPWPRSSCSRAGGRSATTLRPRSCTVIGRCHSLSSSPK